MLAFCVMHVVATRLLVLHELLCTAIEVWRRRGECLRFSRLWTRVTGSRTHCFGSLRYFHENEVQCVPLQARRELVGSTCEATARSRVTSNVRILRGLARRV